MIRRIESESYYFIFFKLQKIGQFAFFSFEKNQKEKTMNKAFGNKIYQTKRIVVGTYFRSE